jgi:sugar phosphate isomerase/epimerase
MRIALCNEVLGGMELERQCEYAAALGYDGLEIAPFTLSTSPEKISTADAAKIRATVEASGLVVTGLHWLLVKPEGLSLTDPDAAVRTRTLAVHWRGCGMPWRRSRWPRPASASSIASSRCRGGKRNW